MGKQFSSNYQFTEPVAEFYGELEEYILVRLEQGKVQVRRFVRDTNKNIKLNSDGTVSPIYPEKPSYFSTKPAHPKTAFIGKGE